jgi:hypothetical protein
MREEATKILSLLRLPGRLTTEQVAPVLGFMPHDIPVLAKAKLLKPLGNPPQNAVKYFASAEIEKCTRDEAWLSKATRAIYYDELQSTIHLPQSVRSTQCKNTPARAVIHETKVVGHNYGNPALRRNEAGKLL